MTHTPLRPERSTGADSGAGVGAGAGNSAASRRPKWPWIAGGVLAVVAAGVTAVAMTGGDEQPVENRPAAEADAGGATALTAGGADGAFAFSATSIECGVA